MGKASRSKKERVNAPVTPPSGAPGSRPSWLLPAAGAGLVVAIVVVVLVLVLAGGGSSSKDVAKAMKAANCTLRDVKPLPPKHDVVSGFHQDVPTLTTKVKWSTDPPSAGAHYSVWAVWDFYFQPVNPRLVVHNEEHGGMVMWWGNKVPGDQIDKMNAFYNEDPRGMIGTPYAKLGDKIALTAWTGDASRYYQHHYYGVGHIAICPRFDETAFKAFRDAYRGHSIEGNSLDADAQGSGPQ